MKIKMTFEQEFDSDDFYSDFSEEERSELTYEQFVEGICDSIELWEIINNAKFKQINEN